MKSAELRSSFLKFFEKNDHEIVASSPLVPANDPTLLFTNAGMVQFKDVFLGQESRDYVRAATSQRCVRAGGKHNDLENVGYTARHHTIFEMLGNFSFGDYFKREAIQYAWDFLTGTLGLPEEKLWVTVYRDDDEAADIWLKKMGVPKSRFARLGAKDNFWAMGDTGPCGPCSEIFYDHGPDVAGGPPGSPDEDGDRYVEIWNLVFMQFNRAANGDMTKLPKPSVDTGMGLERISAVMQGVHSNYEIDLFANLIRAAGDVTGTDDLSNPSLRVIADHIRACAFLVVDGVLPSNEGRGYVLRRIARRAIRHGYRLDVQEPFFNKLTAALDREMGDAFPELRDKRDHVKKVLAQEEERFAQTLHNGMRLLEAVVDGLSGKVIPGETVFKLYDTYGFPVDLTADVARERGLTIDHAGFETAMNEQKNRARSRGQFKTGDGGTGPAIEGRSRFTGYDHLRDEGTVTTLLRDNQPVDALEEGVEGLVVLDRTPFYAESGGQVGDAGLLVGDGVRAQVTDCQKLGDAHAHLVRIERGTIRVGERLTAEVDGQRRQATVLNHSATHLLHAALRKVLGDHVTQKGSLVAPDRLRFDFSHYQPLSTDELDRIETLVNEQIRANADAEIEVMSYDDAMASGAMALFGEKYDDRVRVLRLGDFSVELCGGTHVRRAGDIGLFRITQETGIAAGIRRIEAITGDAALAWARDSDVRLARIAALVKGSRDDAADKVAQVVERARQLEREIEKLKGKMLGSQGDDLVDKAVDVDGIKVVAARLDGADPKSLRDTVDRLKDKLGDAVVVLSAVNGDKVALVAGVSKSRTGTVKAGELVGNVAAKVGGKGGGRPDMAQGGGTDPSGLDQALAAVPDWVRERVSS